MQSLIFGSLFTCQFFVGATAVAANVIELSAVRYEQEGLRRSSIEAERIILHKLLVQKSKHDFLIQSVGFLQGEGQLSLAGNGFSPIVLTNNPFTYCECAALCSVICKFDIRLPRIAFGLHNESADCDV
jgi:hypothetical protein